MVDPGRMTTTMRVMTQTEFGDPGVLHPADRPLPEPLPTEIRVRVTAAGVNPVDWKTRAGGGMAGVLGTPPFVLGWDVAGVVDAVGFGVTRFAVGDRVYGMPWFPRQAGAYAEFVTAPSGQFARVPDGLDDVHAAALPLAALTAWQAFDAAGLGPGQRVLVHAAAGGVGHLAVQFARARGAEVIGTARAAKHDLLADLGVQQAIDYTDGPFEKAVGDVDLVLDGVGGETAVRSVRVLRPGGLLISLPSGLPADAAQAATEAGVRATGLLVEPDGAALTAIAALVADGTVRPLVEETFPLADAARAHTAGERGRTVGKLVLTV
jgi:NADPH:quinone reductase-like Zn-dependent oxidoreductase